MLLFIPMTDYNRFERRVSKAVFFPENMLLQPKFYFSVVEDQDN